MEQEVIESQGWRGICGFRETARAWGLPVLAAVMFIWTTGCSQVNESAPTSRTEAEVVVTQPTMREVPRTIRITGTLHGDEETTIAAKVAGRIVEVMRDLGDAVSPGDPVLQVDPTDYELVRIERERAFFESLAELGLSQLPPVEFDINSLPTVERSRLQADNAAAKYERARQLAEREPPLISEQDYADLHTGWEVAQSNLKVERLTAEATLAEARTLEAQVKIAQQRVQDTVHRAPQMPATHADDSTESGNGSAAYQVAARLVSVGDYVQIGAPLVRLVDADPLKLRASVPERRSGAVQVGQTVAVHVEAFSETFRGQVSRVSPSIDMATRAFPVEILIANQNRRLKPGSFATAEIEIGREQAVLVPENAIVTFAGVQKVLLVTDGKIKEQRVELGAHIENLVEVRRGLEGSERIVLRPAATLANGAAVRVIDNRDQASAASQTTSGIKPEEQQ